MTRYTAIAKACPVMHRSYGVGGLPAQMRVDSALHYGEERLVAPRIVAGEFLTRRILQRLSSLQSLDFGQAAREPPDASLARVPRGGFVGLARDDVVELHDDVGAQVALDLHHDLGREESPRPVDVGLELDAFFIDGPETFQREDLESARVCKDRTFPLHEVVESAHLSHDVVAGAEVQVVCVAEDHRGAHPDEILGIERLHRRQSPDGHECRRFDRSVGSRKNAGPCGAGGALDLESEAHRS